MERIVKITYADRAEAAWVATATTNAGMSGKSEPIKKLITSWTEEANPSELASEARKAGRDANAFLKDFGLLSGGKI
jgi:hypothetical protein